VDLDEHVQIGARCRICPQVAFVSIGAEVSVRQFVYTQRTEVYVACILNDVRKTMQTVGVLECVR
jgi:hypothetical protein